MFLSVAMATRTLHGMETFNNFERGQSKDRSMVSEVLF